MRLWWTPRRWTPRRWTPRWWTPPPRRSARTDPAACCGGCRGRPGRAATRGSTPGRAACAYSLADPACSLSGEPHNYASFGPGIVFNSTTDYFRVRFSVAGLSFTSATLYLAAHADGSGLPRLQVQSQLHGEYLFQPTVPISTHRLYAIDWTPYLAPTDTPSLTAVTLRPMPTGVAVSRPRAVRAMTVDASGVSRPGGRLDPGFAGIEGGWATSPL
jgi:hypothetical protein